MIAFVRHNVISLFFFILILIGCLLPGSQVPESSLVNIDKVLHLVLFAAFSFSLIVGLIKQPTFFLLRINAVKTTLIVGAFYGVLIEFIQHYFITDRTFEVADVIADIAGVALAYFLFKMIVGKEKCCQF